MKFSNSNGLPNSSVKNKNGSALDLYFSKRLGVKNDNQWKHDAKHYAPLFTGLEYVGRDEVMINLHSNALFRQQIFSIRFLNFLKKTQDQPIHVTKNQRWPKNGMRQTKKKSLNPEIKNEQERACILASYEAVSLSDYSAEFVADNKNRHEEKYLASFNLENSALHQELYAEQLPLFVQIISALWKDIKHDLEDWAHSTSKKKTILAEAVWALGTIIDTDIVNQAIEITPCLLNYYEDIIEFQGAADDTITEDELQDTYESIVALANDGVRSPKDKEIAAKIIKISERIIAKNSLVIDKMLFETVLTKFVTQVLDGILFVGINKTDIFDYESCLNNAWSTWLLEHTTVAPGILTDQVELITNITRIPAAELSELCGEIDGVTSQLNDLTKAEPDNLKEKRKLKNQIVALNLKKTNIESKIVEKTDELVSLLFPGENTIENIDQFENEDSTWETKPVTQELLDEIDSFLKTELNPKIMDKPEIIEAKKQEPVDITNEPEPIIHVTSQERHQINSKPDDTKEEQKLHDEIDSSLKTEFSHNIMDEQVLELGVSEAAEIEPFDTANGPELIIHVITQDTDGINNKSDNTEDEQVAPKQLEPVVVDIEEGQTSVEEVNETNSFTDDYELLENNYRQHWLKTGSISPTLVNNASLAFVEKNNLQASYWISKTAVQGGMQTEGLLDSELWRASYFGVNVWDRSSQSLLQAQKILSNIHPHIIDRWSDLRPGGKITPFLIFAATFQTSLFIGGYTSAPTILSMVKHRFDAATERLIKEVLELSNQNEHITIDILRGQKEERNSLTDNTLARQMSDWKNKIVHGHSGWAPMRRALKKCVDNGEFTPIIKIIDANDSAQSNIVAEFVKEYSMLPNIEHLMAKEVGYIQGEFASGQIEGNARNAFLRNINELCEISRHWLFRQDVKSSISGELAEKIARLKTQFKTASSYFKSIAGTSKTYEVIRGAIIAKMAMDNLILAVDGRDSVVWDYKRTKAWFDAPRDLLIKADLDNDPVGQNLKLVSQLNQTAGVDVRIEEAMVSGLYPLAYLLLLQKQDDGSDVKKEMDLLNKASAALRIGLNSRRDKLDAKIAIARDSKLIDEQRFYQLASELDYLKENISKLSNYDSTSEIEDQISTLEKGITDLFSEKLDEKQKEFSIHLKTLRTELGDKAAPESWIKTFHQAFQRWELHSIDEQLSELKDAIKFKTRIREIEVDDLSLNIRFEEVDPIIYEYLAQHTNYREISKLRSTNSPLGIDFSDQPKEFKSALEFVASIRGQKQRNNITKDFYESTVNLLTFLGFRPQVKNYSNALQGMINYNLGDGFVRMNIRLFPSEALAPFPVFGSKHEEQDLAVIFAFNEWEPERLDNLITQDLGGRKPVVISAVPLSRKQRNRFAEYCKNNQRTAFMIDLGMLIFLGTLYQERVGPEAIRNFLYLTTPWTYYNPYVGSDILKPPPVEMRYGRNNEIDKLIRMEGGDAIIFGGRQLGKSTIVSEVQRKSHDPENNKFAFYHLMDANIIRSENGNQQEWELARDKVWNILYKDFIDAGMIKRPLNDDNHEAQKGAIKDGLMSHKDHKIIIIFDEVDPLLNIDHAQNFAIFRGLRELVNMTEDCAQFKLIIAGLQHVRRFQDSPNFPLPQLGGVMQISIMSHNDSAELIKKPLIALGYQFETDSTINRIKSITNRHPGLIQIFCHELVKILASNHDRGAEHALITDNHINIVESLEGFRQMLQNRFDMTLTLDKRYLIIIYGLLFEGKGSKPFSVPEAKAIAEEWLPESFADQSVKQFETFLLELVGLGVLIKVNEQHYSLRNTNVLRLLDAEGNEQNIAHKLDNAIKSLMYFDPLERHAFIMKSNMPCPITFRDEKDLIGTASKQDDDGLFNGKRKTDYTVNIITGSDALGLNDLKETIPYLYETESRNSGRGSSINEYTCEFRHIERIKSSGSLKKLIESVVTKISKAKPVLMILQDDGHQSIHHTIALLDVAHQFAGESLKLIHPVRIVFCLNPKALWNWLSIGDITYNRESLQTFIALNRMKRSGLGYLLSHISMNDTDKEIKRLIVISDGWHSLLKNLCNFKLDEPNKIDLDSFSDRYKELKNCKSKAKRDFIASAGLQDVPWAFPLLKSIIELCGDDHFDSEFVSLLIEERKFDELSKNQTNYVLEWFSRLSLIRKLKREKHTNTSYVINNIIRDCIEGIADE